VASLKNVFTIAQLRNKILFTLAVLVVYRIGTHLPLPGLSVDQINRVRNSTNDGGIVAFLNTFTGGGLTNLSLFCLGIMPYITASIIMQLLQVVIPRLEAWAKEGPTGQRKITQWTRYVAIFLAIIQGTGYAFMFRRGQLPGGQAYEGLDLFDGKFVWTRIGLVVVSVVAGTALVMWMSELITQRGIGNGTSIMIFANVVSRLPFEGVRIWEASKFKFAIVMAIVLAMIVAIVFIENGFRKIPVQFAKRQVGNRIYGGSSSNIPLKVNQSGVVPIIFASSVLYLPLMIGNVFPERVSRWLDRNIVQPDTLWHILTYGVLILFFAYFYTAIAFDPVQQADNLNKQNGFIRGIRPGAATAEHFRYILNRITLPGALFIMLIALVPSFLLLGLDVSGFQFAGTSILIAVGVALETAKQIDSNLMMRNYDGFLEGSDPLRRRPQQQLVR
jgi:preprotein translocase subunit SecY